jgi:hypothetical protein
MKKIISFSLWGNDPKYCDGAIKNAILSKIIYPDWICRFYISDNVDKSIIDKLEKENSEIFIKKDKPDWSSMFWRFEAGYDNNIDIVIFRDTDSRLNLREKNAVDEWEKSDKTFHIMRDHPHHGYPILGGMWGMKVNKKYDFENILKSFKPENQYGTDYVFFINTLFPFIGDDKITHDEFFEKKPFPTKREGYEFVGQVFNGNDETPIEHINALSSYEFF